MKTKNFSRADFVSALCGAEAWAISPAWADTLRGWAVMEDFNPQAIVTQAGERYGSGLSRTSVRDGVGVMQVRGPLFTHENFLTWLFGFDTYESMAGDFQNLINDGNVQGVVLNFHSPGGLVAGASDFSQMIYDARGLKPQGIVSRAGGDMASAAYWLGSSAEKIHVAPTGMVGSIGTVVQFSQEEPGTVTVVSDQSPNKRPDLATPEGMAQMKATLNALSDVFIGAVARNRGVTPDHVVQNFGKGGVKVGADAVAAGMADQLSTFDATFSSVKNSITSSTTQEITMHVNQQQPGATAPAPTPSAEAPVAPAAAAPAAPAVDLVAQERARTSGILGAFAGTSFADEAVGFIESGKSVADAQAHVLGKLKAAPAAAAPAAPAVTQQQLATEGRMATAAAAAPAPSVTGQQSADDQQAAGIRQAMTAGANGYRSQLAGGNSADRFSPSTTPAGR